MLKYQSGQPKAGITGNRGIFWFTFGAEDVSGNKATTRATVSVAHDHGK
jgi:hypothetical protein